mmetsp:Transcript_8000/g.18883  ORF Transcript_8000/g.18883 Transcript_8000/m.18883 type:complete len:243 (+) Transcript_8000:1678-2406(+)
MLPSDPLSPDGSGTCSRTFARKSAPVIAVSGLGTRSPAPSRTRSSGLKMLHLLAIAIAVSRLSPVTILTSTPAPFTFSMAPGTSGRSGSSMPAIPSKVKPCSTSNTSPRMGCSLDAFQSCGTLSKSRYAKPMVRMACLAICSVMISFSMVALLSGRSAVQLPSLFIWREHNASTISDAPFRYIRHPPPVLGTTHAARLRRDENGMSAIPSRLFPVTGSVVWSDGLARAALYVGANISPHSKS